MTDLFLILAGLVLMFSGFFLYRSPRIIVEWQTATEIDTVGFNLYRADQADGNYEKINPTLIPSSDEPLKGGSYQYVDARVVPNRVYYYQLEDIDTQGKGTKHEPISVIAKPQGLIELASGGVMVLMGIILAVKGRQTQIEESEVESN